MGLSCKPCGKYQSMWQKMLNELAKEEKLAQIRKAAEKGSEKSGRRSKKTDKMEKAE